MAKVTRSKEEEEEVVYTVLMRWPCREKQAGAQIPQVGSADT